MRLTIEELKTVQLNWYSDREREGETKIEKQGEIKRNRERERVTQINLEFMRMRKDIERYIEIEGGRSKDRKGKNRRKGEDREEEKRQK